MAEKLLGFVWSRLVASVSTPFIVQYLIFHKAYRTHGTDQICRRGPTTSETARNWHKSLGAPSKSLSKLY